MARFGISYFHRLSCALAEKRASMMRNEGWWLASDGHWYPPESHANYNPAPTVDRDHWAFRREALQWFVMIAIGATLGWLAIGGIIGPVFGAVFVLLARTVAWIATRNRA